MVPWLPENVSSVGRELDATVLALYGVVGALLVIAEGALLWFVMRRGGRFASRAFVESVALMIIGGVGINLRAAAVQRRVERMPDHHDVLVRIEGRRFAWNFRHAGADGLLDTADDIVTNGHLHVPVGKVVKFELVTRDVVHAFLIPGLRLKRDAAPGRTTSGWFEATREGEFAIRCDAACGVGQDAMVAILIVESQEQYEKFLNQQDVR